MRRAWMVVMWVALAWVPATRADAQLTLGGHAGYGAGLNSDPDPYRGLFGVRSGWNFGDFYLGGQVSFYTGESLPAPGGDTSFRQLQVLGIDAGYDIDLTKLILRPVFGVGGAMGFIQAGPRNENRGAAFLNFGAEALSKLIKNRVFVGGGFRITSSFYDPDNVNAFSFYVVAGTRFDFAGDGEGIPMGKAREQSSQHTPGQTKAAEPETKAKSKPEAEAEREAATGHPAP